MKSWKTHLAVVLAMLAVMLAASVPAVADSFEVECEADDGGVCKKDVTVSSYKQGDNDPPKGESVEDSLRQGPAGECDIFGPFCGLDWWPW
jgi:hypothetical protein